MFLLLTNDDGISSPLLKTLADRLSEKHEVWVIAPDREQSGCSHSITIRSPIALKEVATQRYSCSGTPADCVLLALRGFIPVPIDCVISGINIGPNLGTDIIFSGTAAGARQGALMGKPSVAVSINNKNNSLDISWHVEFIKQNLEKFKQYCMPGCFFNINFPKIINNNNRIEITYPGERIYEDTLTRFPGPDGYTYCFIQGEPEPAREKGSDSYAVEAQNISISLVSVQPAIKEIGEISFWKGEND